MAFIPQDRISILSSIWSPPSSSCLSLHHPCPQLQQWLRHPCHQHLGSAAAIAVQLQELGADSEQLIIKLPSWLHCHTLLLQESPVFQLALTAPYTPSIPLSKFWETPGGFLCGKAGGPLLLKSGWRPTAFDSLFSFSTNIWRVATNKGRSGKGSRYDEQRRHVLPLWIQNLSSKPTRRPALWAPWVNVGPHRGVPSRGGRLVWWNLLLPVPLMQKPGRY